MSETPGPREFVVSAWHDDTGEERKHTFRAVARAGFGEGVGMVADGQRRVLTMDRLIRKSMIDSDGTPHAWKPVVVDGHFTAPDGTPQPEEKLPEYLAHDAGSSRRRWHELAYDNDTVTVDLDDALAMFEQLTESVGGRPTKR